MANVWNATGYIVNSVNFCNTASDAQTWYQVDYTRSDGADGFYVTPNNNEKFPRGLSRADFMANVMPLMNTYETTITGCSTDSLTSWEVAPDDPTDYNN